MLNPDVKTNQAKSFQHLRHKIGEIATKTEQERREILRAKKNIFFDTKYWGKMINKRMPVYFDCRQLGGSGIGTYIQNLIRYLYLIAPDLSFELLTGKQNTADIRNYSQFNIKNYNDPIYGIAEQFRWLTKVDPFGLLHVPNYNAPLFYPGQLIVTLHDVCHLAMKQFFPGMLKRIYSGPFLLRVLNKADYIITVSNFSKAEIIKYCQIPAEKIHVIYNGVDPIYKPIPDEESIHVIKKNGLPEEFLLFLGNVKPHKNITGIISGYKLALQENSDLPPLVILGQYTKLEKDIPDINNLLSSSQLREKIIFTGYLPTEDLPAIYSRALLFLFPSFYEGFGLPIFEAMACGTPVISSNCSSIPEVVGDAARLIDPYNYHSIANAITELAQDSELQEAYRIKGFSQAKKYSWEISARKHLEIYESAQQKALSFPRRFRKYAASAKKKANILFLDQYGDRVGGGQVILLDIMEKFRATGFWNVFISIPDEGKFTDILKKRNFSYYCVPTWEPLSFEKIAFIDMFRYVGSSLRSTFYLSKKVKEYDIDVIYCNGGRTFLNGAALSLLFSVKIYFHLHLILENRQKRAVTILGKVPSVKSVIAVSNILETQYKKTAVHKKIKIVANWVSPILVQKPLVKREMKMVLPIRIGIVGQISKAKGQWAVLESLESLKEVIPIQLSIFGEPLVSEPEHWDEFNTKIMVLQKKGWDIRNEGFQSDTLKIYDNLDILIIPSIVPEAFGLTAIEAMAREVIVIANKSGALPEIIQHKRNGLLYDAKKNEKLPLLLQQVVEKQEDILSIRKAGLETVRRLYHPEKQLNKLYDIVGSQIIASMRQMQNAPLN